MINIFVGNMVSFIGGLLDVIFDLNNHTISNSGNIPLFENKGTAIIKNGTLTSNAEQGAVNNRETQSVLTIDNMTIIATGIRQALYNDNKL